MLHLTIDHKPIEVLKGRTILEACRENGIYVPTLCYHPALEPYGACRLCLVEISQPPRPARLVASCTYPCESGMTISTDSEAVKRTRCMTAELLLAGASNSPEIQALAQELGVREVRYHLPEEDRCILCGLCVRACQEIVGVTAISLILRGINRKVSPPFSVSSATCIACGTCTLICPTHAIHLKDITASGATAMVHAPLTEHDPHYCQVCEATDMGNSFAENVYSLAKG